MNNKYLSGLLAGVLTAGVLQGSGGKANMPGLGGQQTPVAQQQSGNNLSFQQMARLLAENSYRNGDVASAEIILNSVGLNGLEIITEWGNAAVPALPTQITHITLNENNGIQSNEGVVDLPEMVLSEPQEPSAPAELTHLTIGENGEIKKKVVTGKKQLDSYSMLQVAQYMDAESTKKVQEVNSKFATEPSSGEIQGHGKIFNQLRKNPSPVTAKNYKLYSNIQTQQIFGPGDYILPGMRQYIIAYPATKAEIEDWVARLQNMHTNEALTPIVFEYQLLPDFWNTDPQGKIITETKDFKIKRYYTDTYTSQWTLEEHNNRQHLRNLGKPIVFKEIDVILEDCTDVYLKDILEPAGAKALLYKFREFYMDYEIYCKLVQKYPAIDNPNLVFPTVDILGQSAEEQREQLKVLSMDKRVFSVKLKHQVQNLIFLELLSNVKNLHANSIDIDNPNLLQKQRSITFSILNSNMQLGNRRIYNFNQIRYEKDIIAEKGREYLQYVKDNNLEYLSGFVNFAEKPNYLTDEEWRKVMVLTGMTDELMDLVDQKFDEYEADPYAASAVDPYGCGGNYGCDGYNPYGKYYYGCGYGC